jgi:DNA-binding NarL/FixJ family response regulator
VSGPGRAGQLRGDLSGRQLGEREVAILHLVAEGSSNPQIAGKLYLSEDTVKTFLMTAFRKLGARNRAHAVYLALKSGVIQ